MQKQHINMELILQI